MNMQRAGVLFSGICLILWSCGDVGSGSEEPTKTGPTTRPEERPDSNAETQTVSGDDERQVHCLAQRDEASCRSEGCVPTLCPIGGKPMFQGCWSSSYVGRCNGYELPLRAHLDSAVNGDARFSLGPVAGIRIGTDWNLMALSKLARQRLLMTFDAKGNTDLRRSGLSLCRQKDYPNHFEVIAALPPFVVTPGESGKQAEQGVPVDMTPAMQKDLSEGRSWFYCDEKRSYGVFESVLPYALRAQADGRRVYEGAVPGWKDVFLPSCEVEIEGFVRAEGWSVVHTPEFEPLQNGCVLRRVKITVTAPDREPLGSRAVVWSIIKAQGWPELIETRQPHRLWVVESGETEVSLEPGRAHACVRAHKAEGVMLEAVPGAPARVHPLQLDEHGCADFETKDGVDYEWVFPGSEKSAPSVTAFRGMPRVALQPNTAD